MFSIHYMEKPPTLSMDELNDHYWLIKKKILLNIYGWDKVRSAANTKGADGRAPRGALEEK